MHKRVTFRNSGCPICWCCRSSSSPPSSSSGRRARRSIQSFLRQDAFGLSVDFVWFDNFARLFDDRHYLAAFWRTLFFSGAVTLSSMGFALLLAVMADRVIKGATATRPC
jgi:sn-glycerol 3-phosphate transport system permease protein